MSDSTLDRPLALGAAGLPADLAVPAGAGALVAFVHGGGSSRLSPRNRLVALALQRRGLATLLFDLLTPDEADDRRKVFDIDLLAHRVADTIDALGAGDPAIARLPLGLFGASTGAAAALRVAARRPHDVAAVVSRGGRPDLAAGALPAVRAPTLLIVGGEDLQVLALNREAFAALGCADKRLEVVPGASHLFEEPGTLDAVARLAGEWFATRLAGAAA